MRFIAGADFTSQSIVKHLMRSTGNKSRVVQRQLARAPEPDV
jgi:hypothetical protein